MKSKLKSRWNSSGVGVIIGITLCCASIQTTQAKDDFNEIDNMALECTGEMVVEPDNYPAESDTLNATIAECIAENPETVFILQRDAVYWIDQPIENDDYKLNLKAEEGEGHLPIIRPTDAASNLISSNNDISLEEIYLLGINESGDPTSPLIHYGTANNLIVDKSVMVGSSFAMVRLEAADNSVYLTDSKFANAGRAHRDLGRFIDARGNNQDTLWMENSTLYNFGHAILTGTSEINYLHLNHNTAVNAPSNIRTEEAHEVAITNNLFLNLSLRGESGIITTSSTGSDESRVYNISNNNIGQYDAAHSVLFETEEDKAHPIDGTLETWIEDGVGADVTYLSNFQEDVTFTDSPMSLVDWMNHYNSSPSPANATYELEWLYDKWNEADTYLDAPRHYTLDDLRDFTYSEEHDSYTAAENGYPVGDLNWFPELKERWGQGLPAESGCSEEMVVEPDNYPEETGNLNAAIETCLAENPETIFTLERDAVYWLSEGLVVDAHKLHLRAEEGEGHIPIIRPADTSDRLITSDNDFTFEGIYLLGVNENGDLNHHVSHNGDNNKIVFDESAMVGNRSTSFILYGVNNSLFVTNSMFANAGRTHWDFGRFINPRAEQDTIWVENTTLYNFVHSILMTSDGIEYLYFNHNTGVNAGSSIRTGQAQEAVITNNLYLNLSLRGESGIISASSTDNDESREYKISNNNIGYYEDDYSDLFMSVFDQPPVLHPTLQEWVDSGTGANVAFEDNFQEGVVFTNPPSNTEMVEWMTAWHQGNDMPEVPPYDKWDEVGDYLGAPNHYTMDDFRDFSYSDEHDSYTAAENGYPVGDLNWFPDLKEQWEQGVSLIEDEITFANVQSPASGEIEEGDEFIVYARIEAAGFTDNGESEDVQAWIGFHTENLSPDEEGWTWLEAEFNTEYTGSGHEYMADIGSGLETGDYFFSSRFQLKSNDYVYGGFDGGFWDGENNVSGQLIVNQATSTDGRDNLPKEFGLQQNYPNPFNPSTNIDYQVPKSSHVLIEVYNILGRKVATLVNDRQPAGYHEVTFNGSGLSSGIYIYRMKVDNFVKIRKLVLAK